MKRLLQWTMAAIMICGAGMITSCDDIDNPAKSAENQDREEFEAALSRALEETSTDVRLDVAKGVFENLSAIISAIDDETLIDLKHTIIGNVMLSAKNYFFDEMDADELAVARKCLAERFNMTDDDFNNTPGYLLLNAYDVFGHLKVTFQNGESTLTESDDFTVENIDKDGGVTSLTIKFCDEHDGVRFFVTRVADITPICINFPKQVEIVLKTADGKELEGTMSMSSDSPFQYISLKHDEWHMDIALESAFWGHHDSHKVAIEHLADGVINTDISMLYDGEEQFTLRVKDARNISLNVGKVINMTPQSTFTDLLGVIEGGVIDEIQAVLNNEVVIKGKINNLSGFFNTFYNVYNMSESDHGFDQVDAYTQKMNEYVDLSLGLKGRKSSARASYITSRPSPDDDYLPCVALQFAGEDEPQTIFSRMSKQDFENYIETKAKVYDIINEVKALHAVIRGKVEAVKSSELF